MTRNEKILAAVAGVAVAGVGAWFLWSRYGYAKLVGGNVSVFDDAQQTSSNGMALTSPGATATPLTLPQGTVVRRNGDAVANMSPIVATVPGSDRTQWWIASFQLGSYFG